MSDGTAISEKVMTIIDDDEMNAGTRMWQYGKKNNSDNGISSYAMRYY